MKIKNCLPLEASAKWGKLKIKSPLFWKHLNKRQRLYFQLFLGAFLVVFIPIIIGSLQKVHKAQAAWFNDNWAYRKSIQVNNNTTAQANVYIILSGTSALDTSDTTRFKSDCGDLRFTDQGGNLLSYYIVSGCGTTTTVVHVEFSMFPAGAQTIYYYYGNPSSADGFSASDLSVFDPIIVSSYHPVVWILIQALIVKTGVCRLV